ncbi:outer membrane-stress sensor serine endopeptidase DegS [Grimontia hollisae]|uniref:Serine endoprotease DegS n=2 Tax=Grimontia hollisae TaxID=673 RepID=D0I4Z8_GRIHO|nr:outer membrane-stress sensor serine endopeptidase DegS [Grimontia hollisae]AMG30261.1 outer membrane-stress sensor serine endopeptidase DegS [Grimontia hollisae]EEY73565.1 outer membrane stress sensor protease DegS [Grimontia hollisae CIP 101886]MDF2183365.1 outer membrane-stress sensor serine endopeptidase DegS [Grimontia hollisae]STO42366.1 Serine endoprotease DegS precursor [Grimontia hollisae]STO56364.1 Serine endoprotease DegS precursor [Grimontia hollisae]
MLAFLARSVGYGVFVAAVLLIAIPSLRTSQLLPDTALASFESDNSLLSYNYAVRRASPAVVNIYTRRYSAENRLQLNAEGLGSGVIMSDKGYIVTNYHVVARADQIIVALQDGRISTAQLVGKDQRTDLAVLKIELDNLPVIPFNDSYKPAVGDVVLAIGNPYNLGQTTTFGIISATGRPGMSFNRRQDFLQTDAAINKGNSGGALVNSRGELVGINTASFQQATDIDTYGISFAIPYSLTLKIMQKLIADGRVIRGYIGVEGREVNPVMARLLDAEELRGVLIASMEPNGPAARSGLMVNDLIVAINGNPISSFRSTLDIVADTRPGTKVPFTVIRQGQSLEVVVTIGEDTL